MKEESILWKHARPLAKLLPVLWLLACGGGDKLPKPTQQGENTFGCKIDGKPWLLLQPAGLVLAWALLVLGGQRPKANTPF